ncbi:hypothetical protein Tco_0744977, partial [Tanacetum coccineum]
MSAKVMALAGGEGTNALSTESECQPVTYERHVRTDLETHLPKP